METEPKHAAAHRWLHQHLLVDEFQDINPLQFALLESWLGPDSTLVVVGDPDQAIYGWNGADPELINTVGNHLPGCAVLHMRANFRSTPEVLAAAGRILGRTPQPAVRPSGEEPTVTVCDGASEAAMLARAVRQRHRPGSSWRRQAVLARTNAQLDPLRKALVRQNIPVATVSEGLPGVRRGPPVARPRLHGGRLHHRAEGRQPPGSVIGRCRPDDLPRRQGTGVARRPSRGPGGRVRAHRPRPYHRSPG